jgi:hypothetical protein
MYVQMSDVQDLRKEVEKMENSDLVEERRKAMHFKELIADTLKDAEESASLLIIKVTFPHLLCQPVAKSLLRVRPDICFTTALA